MPELRDMQTFMLTLQPEASFGTPLVGDTLFGHLCWALRWRHGVVALAALLSGYTEGRPFAVLSDAFPAGLLPRPLMPAGRMAQLVEASQRKADRLNAWLPAARAAESLAAWSAHAKALPNDATPRPGVLTQNTINRLTGTTGTGQFAPRQVERIVHPSGSRLQVYAVLDTTRLGLEDFAQVMRDIGDNGYGRDASTGLGKFRLSGPQPHAWIRPPAARHALTLAPCAPVPDLLHADDCFYQPLSRFGRHGSLHALGGQPFKKPLLLLRSAAVLALRTGGDQSADIPAFHGRGLGGQSDPISAAEPATVHQGYAPLVPLALPPTAKAAA